MKCDELKPLVFSISDLAYVDELAVRKNFDNPHDHAVYKATEVDAAIAELKEAWRSEHEACEALKAKFESVQASAYADSVDAGMRERRLERSLWLARANSAEGQFFYWCARFGVESGFTKTDIRGYSVNTKRRLRTIGEWIEKWKNVKSKCRAKAEEYK